MAKYIDAEALKELFADSAALCNDIDEFPAADVRENRHGRWIETDDGWDGIYFVCSECGCPWTLIDGDPRDNGMNYCPNCGCSMMEGE